MKRTIAVFFLLISMSQYCPPAFADGGNQLSVSVVPTVVLPFGSTPRYFQLGGGADISVEYRLPVPDLLGVRLDLTGSYLPIWTGDGVALFSAGGGPSLYLPNLGAFTNTLFALGGFYYGVIADAQNQSGSNFFLSGGIRSAWQISPSISVGLEAAYQYVSDGAGGALFNGVRLGAGARYSFLRSNPLRIKDIRFIDVFPVQFKYYDSHPIGKVTIENSGTAPVKDVEVSLYVSGYMDNPTSRAVAPMLNGGQDVTVDVYGLFSDKVLTITESTVVSGKVSVSYTQENKHAAVEKSASLNLEDRNAMTWDDDRKIAAFVMYKDPGVLEIAKSIARSVNESGATIDENLSTAMAVHEALRRYRMSYVVDPNSSYVVNSKNASVVDYIQYPRSTIQYKGGDCDDLSVLYASLLQGVGVTTAFITVPGHIYVAAQLKMSPAEAKRLISNSNDLIIHDDRAWVPIEVTMTDKDFLEAWSTGASEWRDNLDTAKFLPVAEAWQTYEPIGYFEDSSLLQFLSDSTLKEVYQQEYTKLVDRELAVHAAGIENRLRQSSRKAPLLNALGIVYARFGRDEKARQYFEEALKAEDYLPAMVNEGNIFYLKGNYQLAASFYEKALQARPNDAVMMLHLSQTYLKMGDVAQSQTYYDDVVKQDPVLASRHTYLAASNSGSTRAAEIPSDREAMIWQE